jgi:hypothetical protein
MSVKTPFLITYFLAVTLFVSALLAKPIKVNASLKDNRTPICPADSGCSPNQPDLNQLFNDPAIGDSY